MTPVASSARGVLIVEDVEEMLSLLDQVVGGMPGFKVSGLAKNVWEARLELGRRKPDLVLLDEILPGESSADLLTEVLGEGIPVILITGVESPSHALPAGVHGRLTKPSWDTLEADRGRFQVAIAKALSG